MIAAHDAMWLDNTSLTHNFWPATFETLAMSVSSTFLAVVFGTIVGLLLVGTAPRGLFPQRVVNQVLGTLVNIGRSIPFVILMIALVPLTRFIAGTSIGWQATVIPLTVAATPFFARLVETNILSVDAGKVEAAKMMGATRNQIMFGVLVREALPALIQSVAVLMISVIGYSAMAGVLGAGGLGALAMNFGYQQFMPDVMIVTIIGIIIIVEIVQIIGDTVSRLVDHR
ncbi:ABC transporter permease [Nanchangia anserum]|uniref:ABC transporter permease n=1 Tax=Nanchangia anserum TaxID=2692125 RepID=A0A8I0GAZ9_9ACTO|nr:methionine ABC transporter permease [Nanchangia anserum]MBD3689473.1 ABC transporter permease [Nanchangia anserum]QOX81667.1 ABC transporter permease [Nanchangia anserum]